MIGIWNCNDIAGQLNQFRLPSRVDGTLCDVQAHMHGGASISSSHLDGEVARSKTWGQAVQYIDEVPAEAVSLHTGMRLPLYCPGLHVKDRRIFLSHATRFTDLQEPSAEQSASCQDCDAS